MNERLCRKRGWRPRRRGSRIGRRSGNVRYQRYPRAGWRETVSVGIGSCLRRKESKEASRSGRSGLTCNFIRFLLAPVPTLMILVANSTPMVWEERTLHSFFTKRCSKQDLFVGIASSAHICELPTLSIKVIMERHSLACPTRS